MGTCDILKKQISKHGLLLGKQTSGKEILDVLGLEVGQGLAVTSPNCTYVFYDEEMPSEQQECVLAHELGHVKMGHTSWSSERTIAMNEEKTYPSWDEMEAEMFAIVYMAVSELLDAYGIRPKAAS